MSLPFCIYEKQEEGTLSVETEQGMGMGQWWEDRVGRNFISKSKIKIIKVYAV